MEHPVSLLLTGNERPSTCVFNQFQLVNHNLSSLIGFSLSPLPSPFFLPPSLLSPSLASPLLPFFLPLPSFSLPSLSLSCAGATSTDRANWFPEQDRQRVSVDGGSKKKIHFERFDALKRDKKMKDVKLSFTTVKPQPGEQQRKYEAYDMRCFPHGVALIINNEEFVRQADREGTGIDEKNLIQTFRYLGYTVEVHRDRTASQIKDIFDEISKRKDHSKHDSFVCCILSHGKEGQIYGSDSEIIEFSEIVGKLNGESCKGLASKPKLFFVQACRGKGRDKGIRVASDSDEPRVESDSDPISIPDDADFYFGYATPSGKVAWRDLDHGSWYVSELCRSLCSRATYADLNHMIQEVHHKVGTDYKNEGYKQAPETTSRLRKDIFFFD